MDPLQEAIARLRLAQEVIDVGYKQLAKELHPDKGGAPEGMVRLNRVRDRLRQGVATSSLPWASLREWKYRPFPKAWEKYGR
jgi:hypothetical protein